jgi:hypothetical protein
MSIALEDLNKETLIELIEKLRSNSGGLTEQKYTAFEMAEYAKQQLSDKEDQLIEKFSLLAAEALHRLEQYEKEINDYRGLFKYFLYNFEHGSPLQLLTTDKYRMDDIIAKYPEHSPFSAGFRAQDDETIDSNTDKEWTDSLKKALRRLVNARDINQQLAKEVQPANEAAKKLLTEYYNYKENISI